MTCSLVGNPSKRFDEDRGLSIWVKAELTSKASLIETHRVQLNDGASTSSFEFLMEPFKPLLTPCLFSLGWGLLEKPECGSNNCEANALQFKVKLVWLINCNSDKKRQSTLWLVRHAMNWIMLDRCRTLWPKPTKIKRQGFAVSQLWFNLTDPLLLVLVELALFYAW